MALKYLLILREYTINSIATTDGSAYFYILVEYRVKFAPLLLLGNTIL